jgi:predicted flap endonuclease-1-like 5' DNA nuclease/phage shock protein A
MIWIAGAAAAVVGLATGWTVRGARNNSGDTQIDWKTRLAARDHDLLEAREQLAAAAAEAQSAVARAHAATSETAELRAEVESLREHAFERDREIERLEDLVIELKAGTTGPDTELLATRSRLREVEAELAASLTDGATDDHASDLLEARGRIAELEARLAAPADAGPGDQLVDRVEELESELATLQSRECPDPDAHHTASIETIVPEPVWDDFLDDDDDLPLAPVVSLRPLGDADDNPVEDPVEQAVDDEPVALLTDAPLFDETLYEDEDADEHAVAATDASDERPLAGEAAPDGEAVPDDLTQIKGIGPQIGGMLNRMGIVSYRDLAALADLDADEIATTFNGLASRLRKGQWIEAARELHMAKYGEAI